MSEYKEKRSKFVNGVVDVFAEWPPANYHSMTEEEEMLIDDSPIGILSAGIIEDGIPVFKLPADYPACMNGALHVDELCHHGLSLWLCADPINHYPPDRSY